MIKYIFIPLLFLVSPSYGQEKILLNEDFIDNSNGWNLRPSEKEFVVDIRRGVLHLEKLTKNFENRGCLWYSKEVDGFDASKDFSIKINAKQINGGDFTEVLDIQWGVTAKDSVSKKAMLYQLNIFMNGSVRLDFFQSKWDNFSKVNIKSKLDEIAFNPKVYNEYEIIQNDAFILLNINGTEVYKQYVFPVEGKSIGFQHCLKGAWEIDKIEVAQHIPIVGNTVQNLISSLDTFSTSITNVVTTNVNDKVVNDISIINKQIQNEGLKIFTASELVIYPNPFINKFNVNFKLAEEGLVTIFLISIFGKVMKEESRIFLKGEVDFSMDVTVPNGVYIVKVVKKDNSNLYKRIVRVGI